jgi:NAD(P)-dependent dehydrogenase (short-subunit alcohol dehydrogenase family)
VGARGRARERDLAGRDRATDFARPITDDPATATRRLERTPLGRFGRVEEIAGAVVWLASSAGAFTTGQNLVIDGGTLVAD